MIKYLVFPLMWICMLSAPFAVLAFMPTDEELRKAESDHFIYIYQAALEDHIPKLTRDCEDAYVLLTPIFKWIPREKVMVLFSDGCDVHNGWATVFPRPTMMIFMADTPPGSTTYEPGDYIRRTVFHEFTHILSMDPQYGLDGILARIFGRVQPAAGDPLSALLMFFSMPPGAAAPTWFIEGLAMWTETEMVGPGRGRNTIVDMIFRMATADRRLLPPTHWDLNQTEWPFGAAAYIYGMKMIQYAHEKYGLGDEERNVIGELSISAADSFPYWFNNRAWSITGFTFSDLALQSIEHEAARQETRIHTLASQPFTVLKRLTPTEIQVYHPRFDQTGRQILFSGAQEEMRSTLYLFNTEGEKEAILRLHQIMADGSFSRLSPTLDRTFYYYTRLDSPRRNKLVSQLYQYDASQNRSRTITSEGRYRFPSVSPDHMSIAAVRAEAGYQVIVEVPLSKAGDRTSERVLVTASSNTTLVDPVYAPDRRTLVYIRADERSSQLRRLNLESGEDILLVEWPAIIIGPIFHPEGRELIFVSDKNGVYNLYRMAYRPNERPMPITHALGGVFQPDFSPDGRKLAVTAYDSHGYYLSLLDYEALKIGVDELPAVEPTWTPMGLNQEQQKAAKDQGAIPGMMDTESYRPYRDVRLDYWSPWLNASPDGAQGGLFFKFSDPVKRHQLMLKGGFESEHKTPLVSAVYDYARFEPILTLYGFHDQTRYDSLIEDTNALYYDYDEEIGGAGAALTFPFDRADHSIYLSFGYQWRRSRAVKETANIFVGNKLINVADLFEGEEASTWLQLQYFNGTAFRRSHSMESGRHLSMAVERVDKDLGGDLNRTRVLGAWNEYVTLPWLNNHVLKLEGHYGTSSGDCTAQSAFGLGGFYEAIGETTPAMPRALGLRGYEENTQVGTDIMKAGVAYRFPIFRFYRGVSATLPIYLHQIFGEVYYEGGRVTGAESVGRDSNKWINSHGFEVNISLTILRYINISPGTGVVYAFDRPAREHAKDGDIPIERWQVYISLKSVVNF